MYLCRGVGAGAPEVDEVVGGVEVEGVLSVKYGGVRGLSCVACLYTFTAIVHLPAVVERFKVDIRVKRDFHQKLLLGAIAFPDNFEFLFWILLPLPHYVQLVEFVLHVRN